jgi:predicted secreted Zn-dependent protease
LSWRRYAQRYALENLVRILILVLAILPLQAYSYPKVDTIENSYTVEANDKGSLLSAINNASPIRESGEVFHAHTDTYVNWNYWWDKRNNYCKLNRVETTVTITYTLPRLSSKTKNAEVKRIWNIYYSALIEHEEGHGQIAIDAAQLIERSLRDLPSYSNCDLLSKKANAKAQWILNKFSQKHFDYDNKTNHGKTQGAYLNLYL